MFTTTTNKFLNVSTYDSGLFSINDYLDQQFESYEVSTDEADDFDFDPNLYGKAILEAFENSLLKNKIEGITLTAVEFDRPKFYNCQDDHILLNVTLSESMATHFDELAHTPAFQTYLIENYSSRDGFWSFVPTNLIEFLESGYKMEILLDFYILEVLEDGKEWIQDMENAMVEYINGNYSYSEFETVKA